MQHLLKLNENSTSLNFKQPRRVLCTNAVSQLTLLLQKAQSRKCTLLTISLVNNISWVAQFEVLIMKITFSTKLPELLNSLKTGHHGKRTQKGKVHQRRGGRWHCLTFWQSAEFFISTKAQNPFFEDSNNHLALLVMSGHHSKVFHDIINQMIEEK